tara:strand:+ start:470 stop:1732 length:1263 start_codon:yes stop_codon:yes gene_type:complete
MKDSNKIYNELKEKLINENFVNLNPISTFEASPKADFETKFANYLAEKKENLEELKPIVNNEEKINTKEEVEKIPAESKAKPQGEGFQISYKADKTVENINSHNYDYNPSVENINNVNGEEMLKGFYCEMKNNPDLTKVEIQEKVIKNLAKDPLFYVKEGQFGVEGLGYSEQKISENDGESYGGSGYSEKLKDSSNNMEIVKESIGGVVTSGNPNPWTEVIHEFIGEEKELPMDEMEDEGTAVSYSDTTLDEKKDHDGDGDIDSDDYLAARDKAIKKAMAKKPKKESIETKLAEIGKAGEITKMEAQLEFLNNYINEKIDRVGSINEDDNLKELVDKKKMKDMMKEIKLLEKRKAKMEKMYEKMSGKKYKQMVDELSPQATFDQSNPTGGPTLDPITQKAGRSTGKSYINRPSGPAKFPQ